MPYAIDNALSEQLVADPIEVFGLHLKAMGNI
jgi:hypothetical protein